MSSAPPKRRQPEETDPYGSIIGALWLITSTIGMIKLFSNWSGFRERAWPMLFVTIFFFPFGFLWPLLDTPGK